DILGAHLATVANALQRLFDGDLDDVLVEQFDVLLDSHDRAAIAFFCAYAAPAHQLFALHFGAAIHAGREAVGEGEDIDPVDAQARTLGVGVVLQPARAR